MRPRELPKAYNNVRILDLGASLEPNKSEVSLLGTHQNVLRPLSLGLHLAPLLSVQVVMRLWKMEETPWGCPPSH